MTLTLSVDDKIASRARERAAALGRSLDELLRDYVEQLATQDDRAAWGEEFRRLSLNSGGHSRGQRWTREEAHERS
ncbi:MAG TPA: MerR family transcriptional regulator [Myxococcota bacterium]|nr:MerR family transcriptional regulator [Myxococcota bacterium]